LRASLGTHRFQRAIRQQAYFLSIGLLPNSTLEAMRTQDSHFVLDRQFANEFAVVREIALR